MGEAPPAVRCGKCGQILDEPTNLSPERRRPCPSCGTVVRAISVVAGDTLTYHESLKLKLGDSTGKTLLESLGGEDLWRKAGKWMRKTRIFDHKNDRYREVVTDPETGEVVHECDEPLSQHRGHGSDKKRSHT
jgi:NAD-dependent SIR2 family protein deacetylase